ncbi:hypothetical protein JCM10207_003306 [Rhodosporidiobolus poonsookiae]
MSAGLGITFDVQSGFNDQQDGAYHIPCRGPPAQAPHLRRTLHHSLSYDDGLNRHAYHQPMIRQPSNDSAGSGEKRVRIAAGTPEVMGGKGDYLHYQPHNLSPLSDFELSSASDTGSSQRFSPASLSDLPSSTESGAHPTFYAQAPPPRLDGAGRYEPTAPGMEAAQSRPYPPPPSLQHGSTSMNRPSRLPAFLQERQRSGGLARPHSMMELRQAYSAPPARPPRPEQAMEEERLEYAEYRSPAEQDQAHLHAQHSPESIPSSAGGLHRRHLERQLQEQKALLEQERRRLRQSEGRPRERTYPEVEPLRPAVKQRSRSLSAQEMRQLAEAELERQPPMTLRRSQSQGFPQLADEDDHERGTADADEDDHGTVISLDNRPLTAGPASVGRQNTLLTSGATSVRRRKELHRLLAPSRKMGSVGLPSIGGSPTPSSTSSAVTSSTRYPPSSKLSSAPTISSPVCLEQSKSNSRARVELDLVLETPLVVEGGLLKGKLELRVRKPKDKEGELWIGRPKVRVIGFEELASNDARYIFFHHAAPVSSIAAANAPPLTLPCFETQPDEEGFCRAKLGQHSVPVRMSLPIGKGAKGPWKGKQGVVRYIAIASVKLKSKTGDNRSIAHFYRHLDVYPYFNPAIALAPAVEPLYAEAAKALFMGGNGKVSLKASMHRETWVAGQRCYVDVRVENESSKKIKTLTLALVRTTTIMRRSSEDGPSQTQSTRKKVAETTLEMGKKGTKGVTAKGSWVGVEVGESADFSPSLLIPADALSIPRGRHIEVSFQVKVSCGGSLSADVSADLPIRIIDFVSLDPPPGHVGASPVIEQQARLMARSWSSNQLRPQPPSQTQRAGQPMNRMVSVDSLRLEDLNGGRGPSRLGQPTLSRVASVDSIRTNDLPRAQPVDEVHEQYLDSPAAYESYQQPAPARGGALVDRALQRQLQHQMSLDCISSAIASATARRTGVQRTPNSLHSVASSADVRSWEDEQEHRSDIGSAVAIEQYYGVPQPGYGEQLLEVASFGGGGMGVQLDELEEVPDDPAYLEQAHLGGVEEYLTVQSSDDEELDAFMQSRFSDDEDADGDEEEPAAPPARVPPSPKRFIVPTSPARSSAPRPRPSSPVKAASGLKASPSQTSLRGKRSPDKFGFATPSSPIKASVDLPAADESSADGFSAPRVRSARPLPTPPSASASRAPPPSVTLSKQSSGSSLRRAGGIVRKAPSVRSLRSVASSCELSGPSPSGIALPPSRSPSLASPKVSPVLATVRTRPSLSPMVNGPSSPRKVVKTPSPALRATRSMADLHGVAASASSDMPPPASTMRRSNMPPSVRSKVAALETRQATLTRLATTSGRARVSNTQLARADSVMSTASTTASDASFKLSDLTRANSVASFKSFKAPILKRGFDDAPPLPPLPSE